MDWAKQLMSSSMKFVRSMLGFPVEDGPEPSDCRSLQVLARNGNWDSLFQCVGTDPANRLDFLANHLDENEQAKGAGLQLLSLAKVVLYFLHSIKYIVIVPAVVLLLIWFAYYLAVHVKSRNESNQFNERMRRVGVKFNDWQNRFVLCMNCLKLLSKKNGAAEHGANGDESQ